MESTSNLLYKGVIDRIGEKISNGTYLPGDRIESLSEIQRNYNVSKITATRVLDELDRAGIVKKVHGKGTFVRGQFVSFKQKEKFSVVKRIVLIAAESMFFNHNSYGARLYTGVRERAREIGIPIRIEQPIPESQYYDGINPGMRLEDGEGLVLYHGNSRKIIGSLTANGNVDWVLLDGVAYGAKCVITDNHNGIHQLMEHLCFLGHKRFAFAPYFSGEASFFNANERLDAFQKEIEFRGIKGLVIESNNFDEIVKQAKSKNGPTAVLFPHDEPALNCIRAMKEAGIKVPDKIHVCGFDGFSPSGKSLDSLTTMKVKPNEIGRAAVDLLLEKNDVKNPGTVPVWRKIKPELIT